METTEPPKRSWWAVAAVYKAIHPNKKSRYLPRRLGERRVFLIHAANRDEAEELGTEIAQSQEHQYRAVGDELVAWKLQKVEDVIELLDSKMGHGTEVYWDWIVDEKRDRKPLIV